MTIEFMYQGKKYVLRGATNQLKSTKAKTINMIEGDNTQFFMLVVATSEDK